MVECKLINKQNYILRYLLSTDISQSTVLWLNRYMAESLPVKKYKNHVNSTDSLDILLKLITSALGGSFKKKTSSYSNELYTESM